MMRVTCLLCGLFTCLSRGASGALLTPHTPFRSTIPTLSATLVDRYSYVGSPAFQFFLCSF
ncbi:Piso0_003323 [Millerozyma farinosa CBS 7064]|uniref:Piso0_003323 protein n=1 Tax=Pichia sorbitophila (strain ATCC MYA-4447 / BCRC 22081 / CBS 7064 / NBRC 10061 / NRRL Y-12695) TaxID=559304 RepID=G8YHT4_PICSO|nr:Piso0_003323 [Millerozyma farinosa CBS 7064]CCE80986.1 Piso0_003323 [Millerozyma farinosa CBS 7064]